MSQYKPVSDLKVKVREYEKDGKTKGVWQTVGTLWSTPHGSSQFITLDAIPVTVSKDGEKVPFDGRISVFRREELNNAESDSHFSKKEYNDTDRFNKTQSKDVAPEDIDDKPVSLDDIEIPF